MKVLLRVYRKCFQKKYEVIMNYLLVQKEKFTKRKKLELIDFDEDNGNFKCSKSPEKRSFNSDSNSYIPKNLKTRKL